MRLGDAVAKVTTNLGLTGCVPCQKRQERMNQWSERVTEKIKTVFTKAE